MKHPPYAYLFACAILAAAVLLSAYNNDNDWMLLCAFVVVVFPRWRGKLYRLAEKWLTKSDRPPR